MGSKARGLDDPQRAECCAHRLGDIAGRQMTVVFLDHAGIGMPQLFGDHRQRQAAHRQAARIGMTQRVEVDGGVDPSRFTSHLERALKKSGQNIPKNRCRTTIAERVMETLAELPLTGDQVVCLSHEPVVKGRILIQDAQGSC